MTTAAALRRQAPRNPARIFTELRFALGWPRTHLAERLAVDEKQIRRWEGGAEIPPSVIAWMIDLYAWIERNPPPRRPFEKD